MGLVDQSEWQKTGKSHWFTHSIGWQKENLMGIILYSWE